MTDIYRLVYTSRSVLGRDADAHGRIIARIVETSQRNNARAGITGALMPSAGSFVQVLEGSRTAVEETFERIQRDPRHSDVTVLQCESVGARIFSDWSMAFVGCSTRGRALWDGLAQSTGLDLAHAQGDVLCAALLAVLKAEERGDGATSPATSPSGLDVERLRSALGNERPLLRAVGAVATAAEAPVPTLLSPPRPPAPAPPTSSGDLGVQGHVLRAALDAERERTTALRRELDEVHIAFAQSQGEVEALERHRDIWSDRSSQLRTSLAQVRDGLRASEAERDELRSRMAAHDDEVATLSLQRDVWSDRARALAAALCRDPLVDLQAPARPEPIRPVADRERPSLGRDANRSEAPPRSDDGPNSRASRQGLR